LRIEYNILFSDDSTESCDTSNSDSTSEQKLWSKEDMKALFEIRSKKEKEFNGNKVHKSLWESVSKELSDIGVTATGNQCMNKWKAMKREYKKQSITMHKQVQEKNVSFF
jgi:hypothetical protein